MALQARAEITRKQVMEGAALSFDQLGFGGASLSGILAHANVTKGALYFHFESKEALARAIIEETHRMAAEASARALAESSTPTEVMIRISQYRAEQLMTEPISRAGMRLALEIGIVEGPETKPVVDWADAVGDLAQRGIQIGELRSTVDTAALGRILASTFTGIQLVSQAMSGRRDLIGRIVEMWQLLLPTIATEEALPRLLDIAISGGRSNESESVPPVR
ncbi:MAG: TetR/AcrR family transcriptional regulator [Rhodococcus sp.]|nr:TetR/AcrR family transcriptional regulator [Rhodococcus sp. (in: high G+C Gram-positive bacteria)]